MLFICLVDYFFLYSHALALLGQSAKVLNFLVSEGLDPQRTLSFVVVVPVTRLRRN